MTEQQYNLMKIVKESKAKADAKEIVLDELHGKVDIKWYGHSGFKIHFLD